MKWLYTHKHTHIFCSKWEVCVQTLSKIFFVAQCTQHISSSIYRFNIDSRWPHFSKWFRKLIWHIKCVCVSVWNVWKLWTNWSMSPSVCMCMCIYKSWSFNNLRNFVDSIFGRLISIGHATDFYASIFIIVIIYLDFGHSYFNGMVWNCSCERAHTHTLAHDIIDIYTMVNDGDGFVVVAVAVCAVRVHQII